MTVEEKVYALLAAASGVTALVPASRIKPPGNWQEMARPYIVHLPIAAAPNYTHGGKVKLTKWVYQVSAFADSYSSARAVTQAVVSALSGNKDGVQVFWRDQTHIYEQDINVHQIALDFEVFEAL